MSQTSRRGFLLKTGAAASVGLLGGMLLKTARANAPKLLRPPGAGKEEDFLSACIRCGQCVEACPTDVLHTARIGAGVAVGTPYLVPKKTPCNLCKGRETLECISACPTAALSETARPKVRMGMAVIDHDICYPWIGVSCMSCWHACPFPNDAIYLDELRRAVIVEDACVGCGLCVYACPTPVTAIKIVPMAIWKNEQETPEEKG